MPWPGPYIIVYCIVLYHIALYYLREVGALPEDTSRGVEAVKVPETRKDGYAVLGAPWGRPEKSIYLR